LLHAELGQALQACSLPYEIIFVDDGSRDGSGALLEELCRQDPCVRVIQFRRNFGKSAALSAAFARVRGEIIITMDADLQDDPQEIPRFREKIAEGYDLVSGWKNPRLDPPTKTLPSKFFNFATSLATGVFLHDHNCGFKAYRREVIEELEIYGELYRYIPVLAYWRGFNVTEIEVRHRPRRFGRSKYGLARFVQGFFDLITVYFLIQYIRRPLHLFGWMGIAAFLSGLVINLYLTVLWFMGDRPIGNRPLLMLGVLLLIMGFQFFSFGLLGDIMTKASFSSHDDYSIRKELP
jgi:glycosyltransferase involved in cell wall biosynthesis